MSAGIYANEIGHRAESVRRLIQEQTEPWKIDHEEAMRACDAEIAISEAISFAQFGKKVVHRWEMAIANNSVDDYFILAEGLRNVLRYVSDICHEAQKLSIEFADKGFDISGRSDLDILISETEKQLSALDDEWPKWDSVTVEQARNDMKSRRFQSAKEILDEIRRSRSNDSEGKNHFLESSD